MKIDSSDVIVALCLVAGSVLIGFGSVEPDKFDIVLAGVLGYVARQATK